MTTSTSDSTRRGNRTVAVVLGALALLLVGAGSAFGSHALTQPDGDRVHWADADPGFPRGYVYWDDQTGAEWPVYSAAVEWDKASRLDAVYTTASCTGSHCVRVHEANLNAGCSAPYGETDVPASTAGHFTTNVDVRVDAQWGTRAASHRRELVCHELGHSIGLDDRASTAPSCMREGNMIGETLPNGHDYDVLYNSYDHSD